MDPRVHTSKIDLGEQLKFAQQIDTLLNKSVSVYDKIDNKLKMTKVNLPDAMTDSLSTISKAGNPNLSGAINALSSLVTAVQSADAAPTKGQKEVYSYYKKQIDGLLYRWHKIEKK